MSMPQQSVELVAARPGEWGLRFARERDRILGLLPTARIAHIGSTAIPDLPAKDVVDVLVGVSAGAVTASAAVLRDHGYDLEGDREDHAWLSRPDRHRRTVVVHVMVTGSPRWADRITFRDALRASGELRDAYLALKRVAAATADGWGAYTAQKADFVRMVLDRL